jgi:hypothetical protein
MYIHTCKKCCMQKYKHAFMHTYTHTYIHTYIHIHYIRVYTVTYTLTCIHTYIHTYTYITYIHSHIHTYIRTYIHIDYLYTFTHTHLHAYIHFIQRVSKLQRPLVTSRNIHSVLSCVCRNPIYFPHKVMALCLRSQCAMLKVKSKHQQAKQSMTLCIYIF